MIEIRGGGDLVRRLRYIGNDQGWMGAERILHSVQDDTFGLRGCVAVIRRLPPFDTAYGLPFDRLRTQLSTPVKC